MLFIILFLILVACMIFSIIIICWKSDENRQREWREKIVLFSKICFYLSITSISLFFIEIIFLSLAFKGAKKYYPCYGDGEYEVHVKIYVGFFVFKQNNNNFTSSINSTTIADLAENKNNNRILSYNYDEDYEDDEYEEYICYEELLTSAVYFMAYFTFIISEFFNMVALCFFKVLEDSRECYYFTVRKESNVDERNQNVSYNDIQTPQVIIVNQTKNNTNQDNNKNDNTKQSNNLKLNKKSNELNEIKRDLSEKDNNYITKYQNAKEEEITLKKQNTANIKDDNDRKKIN